MRQKLTQATGNPCNWNEERDAMSRHELPRIYEIHDSINKFVFPQSFFIDFDNSIASNPIKRIHFLHIESELAKLDAKAWEQLKAKTVPHFQKPHEKRAWSPAFDKLNEAKGYIYLIKTGCSDVEFIPENSRGNRRTPDVRGRAATKHILCEVKTVNISDDEVGARKNMTARSIQGELPQQFFDKVSSQIQSAKEQMDDYEPDSEIRKVVYFILNFDDLLHEHIGTYFGQLRNYCLTANTSYAEIVFDVKPAFYSASREPLRPRLFVCPSDGSTFYELELPSC